MECWSFGVLEFWSFGVLEFWSSGVVEHAQREAGAKAIVEVWERRGGGDKGLMKHSLLYQAELRSLKWNRWDSNPRPEG